MVGDDINHWKGYINGPVMKYIIIQIYNIYNYQIHKFSVFH